MERQGRHQSPIRSGDFQPGAHQPSGPKTRRSGPLVHQPLPLGQCPQRPPTNRAGPCRRHSHRWQPTYLTQEDSYLGSGANKTTIHGGVIEKIKLTIDGRDYDPANASYSKYKDTLCSFDFFVKHLNAATVSPWRALWPVQRGSAGSHQTVPQLHPRHPFPGQSTPPHRPMTKLTKTQRDQLVGVAVAAVVAMAAWCTSSSWPSSRNSTASKPNATK